MSMSTMVGSFLNWQERHLARRDHHPLEVLDDADDAAAVSRTSTAAPTSVTSPEPEIPTHATNTDLSDPPELVPSDTSTIEVETMVPEDEAAVVPVTTAATTRTSLTVRQAMRNGDGLARTDGRVSLQELEEERELARRRTSACVLLAVFVLFRLWIEAIAHADFGLLMLCLVGTSWTARWVSYNRDREDELDRRIQAYVETAEEGTTEVNRSDLRMLSFQAQLALAIMESQRNMMEGGYGHPDGQVGHQGVSDQARSQWEDFQYEVKKGKGKYGSVAQHDDLEKGDESEEVCTICLGEYEDGEQLVKLPCKHIYHVDCISSWTSNHTRCPLCNYNLSEINVTSSLQGTADDFV